MCECVCPVMDHLPGIDPRKLLQGTKLRSHSTG